MTAQMARLIASSSMAHQTYGASSEPLPESGEDAFASYLATNGFQAVTLHHTHHQSVQPEPLGAPNQVACKRARTYHGPGKRPPQPHPMSVVQRGRANKHIYPYRETGKPRHPLEFTPDEVEKAISSMGPKHEAMLRRQYMKCDVRDLLQGIVESLDQRIVQAEEQLNELQKIRESAQDRLERYAESAVDSDENTDSSSQEEMEHDGEGIGE